MPAANDGGTLHPVQSLYTLEFAALLVQHINAESANPNMPAPVIGNRPHIVLYTVLIPISHCHGISDELILADGIFHKSFRIDAHP